MTEETLFAAALEKSTLAERAAFLDEACAGDAALRQRVEALLQSHEHADFLKTPAVQQAAEALGDTALARALGAEPTGGEDPKSSLEFLVPSEKPGSLGRLGHYEVLEVVGRGGMGIVLKALDQTLNRIVAIKVLAPQQWATSATARKRFVREAQAAAAVRNDHVIGIHAVEEASQPPYLVMEYIHGISLQQRLDQQGPLELKEILRIGMQTAAGLGAAHAHGLVHRDIKPANILLENGVERVKITDFGLARAVDDASLTQSGVIVGTPQYMAPEQASGAAIDHRADLFSLGSVLYVMCSGRPPFRAEGAMAVLKCIGEETPRPLRQLNPEIPDWLEAIVARLHAKKPEQRFQSAEEVAALLAAHLAHLQSPSQAPLPPALAPSPLPTGPDERTAPAARPETLARQLRAPALFLVITGVFNWLALAVSAAAFGLVLDPSFRDEHAWVMAVVMPVLFVGSAVILFGALKMMWMESYGWALTSAVCAVLISPGNLLGLPVGVWALGTLLRRDVREAFRASRPAPRRRRGAVAGGILVLWLGGLALTEATGLTNLRGTMIRAFTTNGTPVAETGGLESRDKPPAATEVGEIRRFEGHTHALRSVSVSSGGARVLSVSADLTMRLWEVKSERELLRFEVTSVPRQAVLLPDGRRAVSADQDWRVRLWDVETGKELFAFTGHTGGLLCVGCSADGRRGISGGDDRTVRVWDLTARKELRCFQGHQGSIWSVALSPDGHYALSSAGGGDHELQLWDVDGGKELRAFKGHTNWVRRVAFSPDGQRVLSAGSDQTVRLWDVKSGEELHCIQTHTVITDAAFSPDGRRIISGGLDKLLRLWDAETGKEICGFAGHESAVNCVAYSGDGRFAVSGGYIGDPTIRLWQLPKLEKLK